MPASPGAARLSDVELLARLVAFDTTSHRSNRPLADFLAAYLERPGVTVVHHPSPDGAKANLLVRVGPPLEPHGDDAPRPGLVLSGHMDVVPADEDGWTSDPFTLTDRGDRLVARGSADMKGFLALAANLARETDPDSLDAPLILAFTYDEEVGTLGAHHLVETWDRVAPEVGPLPRATVIGEPTELRAIRLHKGHLKMRFRFTGRSAHSGYPHLGVNAIEAAGRAIVALSALRHELERERTAASRHFPEVPFAALNVGTVAGGSAINVVPDRCTLEVGARVLPGMDPEELAERIRSTVARAVAGEAGRPGDGPVEPVAVQPPRGPATGADDGAPAGPAPEPSRSSPAGEPLPGEPVPVRSDLLSSSPPLETADDAPLHRHLCHALGQECGPDETGVSFATDAGWLARLGLDCVIFGPGSIEVAHRPDESVPRADLVAARSRLGELVHHFCRGQTA